MTEQLPNSMYRRILVLDDEHNGRLVAYTRMNEIVPQSPKKANEIACSTGEFASQV